MPVRVLIWTVGVPALLVLLLYARLLLGPLDLSFFRSQVDAAVRDSLPPQMELQIGKLALSLDSALRPILRFTPVKLTDSQNGASMTAEALDIGFSPLFAAIGQPSAVVTLEGLRVQVVQDLLGPRLARFELSEDKETGETIVRLRSGNTEQPSVGILAKGLTLRDGNTAGALTGLRSDNDWLIYNLDATEQALSTLIGQAKAGKFSKLSVRDGQVEMLDPVYGLVRELNDVAFSITPQFANRDTKGKFSANIGGHETRGTFVRSVGPSGQPVFSVDIGNMDYAALVPFLDDPDAKIAVRGAGRFAGTFRFDAPAGKVISGTLDVDLGGTFLRMRRALFPINEAKGRLIWTPETATFKLNEMRLRVAESSALVTGTFVLGLDKKFGPTVSMAIDARHVLIAPKDMPQPTQPFDDLSMTGWSAPLYGAVGIDKLVVHKPGMELRAKGRIDAVRRGVGLDLTIGGEGASADDLKRLWPFFVADKGRDWFVAHISSGTVQSATARFNFPVGSLPLEDGEVLPWHKNSVRIDMIGTGVTLKGTDLLPPLSAQSPVRFAMRDGTISMGLAQGGVLDGGAKAQLSDVAFSMDLNDPQSTKIKIAGNVRGDVSEIAGTALAALGDEGAANLNLPVQPSQISGTVNAQVTASVDLDVTGQPQAIDYDVTGAVSNFAASVPLDGHKLDQGNFSFSARPDKYAMVGRIGVDGALVDVGVDGVPDAGSPQISSTLDAKALKQLGYDVSEFITGPIGVKVQPQDDGTLDVAVNLDNAGLTVTDLGLAKPAGIPGELTAHIGLDGSRIKLDKVSLGFGGVKLAGDIVLDTKNGLQSADFSEFALSKGDNSQISVKPHGNGFAVTVRGDQLDLKPMLERYFALDKVSTGGPQSTTVSQEIVVDAVLKRALGYYSTTAYNFDLKLDLAGDDLRSVSLQAQFAEGNSVSITTNPVADGRVMTAAANDTGTLLRFLNVYPRLLGGTGSLVMHTNTKTKVDRGEIRLRDFSIVDEQNVAEVLGNHKDSRALIATQNRLNFNDAKGKFVRRSDRIEVEDAVLDGGEIGGTLRGFIYTKTRQYDLSGTYVPLFALNSVFQKIPIFGPLLGGREGEGLIGVTFAIRGSLDRPSFLVNPASLLLPGAFRALTEFRAKEAPREGAAPPAGQ